MPEIRATQIFSAVFFHLVQSILIPLRIPNQVCLRLSIKDSALSENLIHPPGTIFIAIVLASWTMFNHESLLSVKSIDLFKSRDGEWTAIHWDSLHTGATP